MNRSAQLGFLQKLILLLAGALVLSAVIGVYVSKSSDAGDIERCRTSALIMHTGREKLDSKLMDLDCDMKLIKIRYKDVADRDGIDERKVMHIFAREMKNLWYEMGEGEFRPFDKNLVYGAKNPCVIIAKISFDDKIRKEYADTAISGFEEYLKTTKIKRSDQNYYDYLQMDTYRTMGIPFIYFWDIKDNTLKGSDAIDPKKDYYIVYNVFDPASLCDPGSWINKIMDSIDACHDYPTVYLYMASSEDLSSIGCDYIANRVE